MKNSTTLLLTIGALVCLGVGAAVLHADADSLSSDIEALGAEDAGSRNAAITKLEKHPSATASALIDELGEDHNAMAKGAMAQIIKKIGPATSDAADLKAHLASSDPVVRHAAATALQAKPSLAMRELEKLALNPKEQVSIRCAAVMALGNATNSAIGPLADIADDVEQPDSLRACALRATCMNSAAGCVATRLRAFDTDLTDAFRLQAVRALAVEGSKGHKELTAIAKAQWPFLTIEALSVMPQTKDATLLATTSTMLGHANAQIRLAALRATIALGGEGTYKSKIKGMIADADPAVQMYAIQSVARSYDKTATAVITALKAQLVNPSFRVRYEASLALNTLGDKAGAVPMAADKAMANQAHAKMANAAWKLITGN